MSCLLRKANIKNAQIILDWRNDLLRRNSSFSKKIIDFETHIKWFRNKLSNKNCLMYMLMDELECVGLLRIDVVYGFGL